MSYYRRYPLPIFGYKKANSDAIKIALPDCRSKVLFQILVNLVQYTTTTTTTTIISNYMEREYKM